MEEMFKKLECINNMFGELEERVYETSFSNYYTFFASEKERRERLEFLRAVKSRLIRMKFRALENIQVECEKQKFLLSETQRANNLIVA